jgi:hypothetical protein
MAEEQPAEPPSSGKVDESELEPVTRDGRFISRLILALIVGAMLAIVVGAYIRGAAANCGSSIVRPGSTVIPPH